MDEKQKEQILFEQARKILENLVKITDNLVVITGRIVQDALEDQK